jgi:subtilase family serine protease
VRKAVAVTGYTHVQNHIQQGGRVLLRWCGLVRNFAHRKHPWLSGLLVGALLIAMPKQTAAQGSAAQARVTTQIDESKMSVVSGNLHPQARPQNDQGKADPSLKLERITMMFQPTAAQQADLNALLAAQQNPTSPSFHQWLTPAQYADRFGVTQSDLTQVSTWLQAQGFAVVETPPSRTWIVFGGTAAQVESAFHTEIHNYAANAKTFYANSAEPSVPAALAGMVLGFRGLNNYPVKPRAIKKSGVSSVQPNFTSGISGFHYIAPDDFATIYDLKALYSLSSPINGAGQKIVIVGQSNIVLADIAAFRTASGLPPNVPTVTFATGSSDPGVLNNSGDEQESSIDIEWAGAVARNATIIFVVSSNGVFDSLDRKSVV